VMNGALMLIIASRRRNVDEVCNGRSHSYKNRSGDGRSVEMMLR
jgi:hypothetical protein